MFIAIIGMFLRTVAAKPMGVYWPLAVIASAGFDIAPHVRASREEVTDDGHPLTNDEAYKGVFDLAGLILIR